MTPDQFGQVYTVEGTVTFDFDRVVGVHIDAREVVVVTTEGGVARLRLPSTSLHSHSAPNPFIAAWKARARWRSERVTPSSKVLS